jgi:flagellar L-ring protein precursor FlgH
MCGDARAVRRVTWVCLTLALVLPARAGAQAPASAQAPGPTNGGEGYDQLVAKYLAEARAVNTRGEANPTWSWMNGLAMDTRARGLNDLVTIRVVENITATGSADSALSKENEGTASLFSLFGLERKIPKYFDPALLVGGRSSTDFSGSGATSRAGQLTANLTARVSEVLPNGDLFVEGVREIEINGDRQILVLTGVVRPFDINQANVIDSTAVGQLRIRYFGQGLIKDNLKPGFLVRLMNRIF